MKKMVNFILALSMILSCSAVTATANADNNENLIGDANCDSELSMADAVLIMQSIANPAKFGIDGTAENRITEQGQKNADITGDNDGVTNSDALAIQKKLLGLNGDINSGKPLEEDVIYFGYPDPDSAVSAPMSSVRTALKCKSFSPIDEAMSVDVAMLGIYRPQGYEGNTFLYDYSIYPCKNWERIEDTRLTVNGETGGFTKEYTGKERDIFNVGREYDDYSTYHHETASLDFSSYPSGSSGSIMFILKAVFLNDDGTMPEHPSTTGGGQILYFYVGEDGVGISNTSVEDAEEAYKTKVSGEVTPPDTYTGRWHGKNISYGLYEALKADNTEVIPVSVTLTDRGSSEFVYNGRTIQEYVYDTFGEDVSKLEQLLEQGDIIKYGEAVYTTGTPDGIIWTESMYNYRIEFYGDELISKYIVDGEFLKEQLQADLKELKDGYKAALDEAVEAFYTARIEETIAALEAQGIRSERIDNTHDIVMYVTADEFDKLPLESASYFGIFQEKTVTF